MISDKIAWLIETNEGGNKARFARKIGIKNGHTGLVHRWVDGSAKPKTEYRHAICSAYGMPATWLDDDDPESPQVRKGRVVRLYLLLQKYAKAPDSFYQRELDTQGLNGQAMLAFRDAESDALEKYRAEIEYLFRYMDIDPRDADKWGSTSAPWKGMVVEDGSGGIASYIDMEYVERKPRKVSPPAAGNTCAIPSIIAPQSVPSDSGTVTITGEDVSRILRLWEKDRDGATVREDKLMGIVEKQAGAIDVFARKVEQMSLFGDSDKRGSPPSRRTTRERVS